MFFRFGCALCLAAAVSVIGVAIEKATLVTRREVSRQHYQTDVLREEHARLRLKTQQLGAPKRLIESIEQGRVSLKRLNGPAPAPAPSSSRSRKRPLLQWQIPQSPE